MLSMVDLLRKLFLAHTQGDDSAFRLAAQELIEEERRRKHHVVAKDLERILGIGNGSPKTRAETLTLLGKAAGQLPRDKERGAVLVELTEPERRLDELVLDVKTRQGLNRIVEEQRRAELLRSHGLKPLTKVLFCGPPGCGKTVAAEAIAREVSLPLALVRFDAVVSSYLGETAANLRKVFDFARSRPMVLLFDEFDAIGKRRTDPDEHGELKRVVNSFLQMLDSFRGETLAIAATNHQGLLDPALWRRFDEIVFFEKPDPRAIEQLLVAQLRQVGVSPSIRLGQVVRKLEGISHADVERIAVETVKETVLKSLPEVTEVVLEEAIARQNDRLAVTTQRSNKSGSEAKSSSARKKRGS